MDDNKKEIEKTTSGELEQSNIIKQPSEQLEASDEIKPPSYGVERPLDGVESPLDGVESPLDGVEPPLDGVKSPLDGVEPPLDGLESSLDREERELESLQGEQVKSKLKKLEVNIKDYNNIKYDYLEFLGHNLLFGEKHDKKVFKNNIYVITFLIFLNNFSSLKKSEDNEQKLLFTNIEKFLESDKYISLLEVFKSKSTEDLQDKTIEDLQVGGEFKLFGITFNKTNKEEFKFSEILKINQENLNIPINLFNINDILINFLKCFDFDFETEVNDPYKDLLYYYINFKNKKKLFIKYENLNNFIEVYLNKYIDKDFLLNYIKLKNDIYIDLDFNTIEEIKKLIIEYTEKQNSIITFNLNQLNEKIVIDYNEKIFKLKDFNLDKIINIKVFKEYIDTTFINKFKKLIKRIFIKLFENHSNIKVYNKSYEKIIGGKKYKKTKNKKYCKNKKSTKKRKKRRLSKKK